MPLLRRPAASLLRRPAAAATTPAAAAVAAPAPDLVAWAEQLDLGPEQGFDVGQSYHVYLVTLSRALASTLLGAPHLRVPTEGRIFDPTVADVVHRS